MIGAFLTFLTNSRLARGIAWAVAGIVAVLSFGAIKRREGVQAERAKEAARDAVADQDAHERMNHADLGTGASDDERIERLRDFAAKHGYGSAKKPGR